MLSQAAPVLECDLATRSRAVRAAPDDILYSRGGSASGHTLVWGFKAEGGDLAKATASESSHQGRPVASSGSVRGSDRGTPAEGEW